MDFKLSVTSEELNTIAAGLNELPRKLSNDLFVKLDEQVKAQVEAALRPKAPEKEPEPPTPLRPV